MSNTMQTFLAAATQKAADDLAAALLRLPEDKRGWSPEDKARTALDQVAECAVLNGYTAELIQTHVWSVTNFDVFLQEKATAAALEWEPLHALLQENAKKVSAAIRATTDDALTIEIQMPWSKQTLAEVLAYPYWNMTYHQGQINYIASLLA